MQARLGELSAKPLQLRKRAPRLLSYLLKCGCCGGGMAMISADRYGCSTARNKGTCDNRQTIKQVELEHAVIGTLRARLMNPALVETFAREYTQYSNRLRMSHNATVASRRGELISVEKRIKQIVKAIGDGADIAFLRDEAHALQQWKDQLLAEVDARPEAAVLIHPNMALHYQSEINRLVAAMNNPRDRDEAGHRLRKLIDKIVLTPVGGGKMTVDLYGDLGGILLMSRGRTPAYITNKNSGLSLAQTAEIEQAKMVASGATALPDMIRQV